MFRNDFIGVLQANKIVSTVTDKIYDTAKFVTGTELTTYDGFRGQKIHGTHSGIRGGLRKLKIKSIQAYPLQSGAGTIHIVDYESGVEVITSIAVTFVANQINTFVLPEPYVCKNPDVAVVVDNADIAFVSSKITCKTGCHGDSKNPCGWVDGWDGLKAVRDEGYGLNIQFYCHCDYDSLICDFSSAFTGELLWLKMQAMVFEEQYKTNRFNNWVTFNRSDIWDNILPELRNRYAIKFNNMVESGMLEMLKQYRDECLNCRGNRLITNV